MQRITPFLWFDNNAEEAMSFYVSVFKNSKVNRVTRYGEAGPGPTGTVMTVEFELDGQEFVGLNGGPHFHFTETRNGSDAEDGQDRYRANKTRLRRTPQLDGFLQLSKPGNWAD